MKYYLVAVLGEESYNYVSQVQRKICKKHRLYRNTARLHITLEVADGPNDINKVSKIVESIIKPYKKFKVVINDLIDINTEEKSVTMKVENKGYILRLARQISDKLKMYGFNTKGDFDNKNLNIKLANMNHNIKDNNKFNWDNNHKSESSKTISIEKIEILKSDNGRNESILKSFLLREY